MAHNPAEGQASRSLLVGDGIGCVLCVVAMFLSLQNLGGDVTYDEGILLTHSWLLSQGFQPHRDFYTNYPPGIYLLITALWRITGPSPWLLRWLGLGIRVAIALLAGRIAGAAVGRPMIVLVSGLTLMWLAPLEPTPYAWLAALAMALLAFEAWLAAQRRPKALLDFLAGLTLAGVSCFRHDLFLGLGGVLILLGMSRRRLPPLARAVPFAIGLAMPLLLVWLPLLVTAGWRLVLRDLLLDQIVYIEPGRHLPLPRLLTPIGGVPAFLMFPLSGAVALTLVGPVVAAVLLIGATRVGVADRRPVALLGALAIADLPQMLSRADIYHAIFTVTPPLALTGVLVTGLSARLSSIGRRAVLLMASAILMLLPLHRWLVSRSFEMPRFPSGPAPYFGLPATPERLEALAFVARHTRPGERIYFGSTQHRRLFLNEVDFYFFARRPGATRYLQFDPNMQNRAEVQKVMIAELDLHRPRLAVLSPSPLSMEPNESQLEGSAELDEYLGRHYRLVSRAGSYEMLWRTDAPLSP